MQSLAIQKLRKFMVDNRHNSRTLAEKTGLSPMTIRNYLGQSTYPNVISIKALEEATNGKVKPIDWFKEAKS